MLQETAWVLTVLLVGVMLLIFGFVAWQAPVRTNYELVRKTSSRLRVGLFWGLVLLFTPILVWSLAELPYSPPDEPSGTVQRIDAMGHQWYWTLSEKRVFVDRPVALHVTSADVNHGFAIYDPAMQLVAQTQAMPGYTNVLHYTFTQPGTYQILCLEYCGLAHHAMMAELTVTASP